MISDEVAKAAQEVAKLGQQGLQSADRAGEYLTKTFRAAIGHLAGAVSDSAEGFKIRNRAEVIIKTRKRLELLGLDDSLQPISDRLALPLLDAISVESDRSIQDIWASYIANALNPSRPAISINRVLIDVIRSLEPGDLVILRRTFESDLERPKLDPDELRSQDFGVSAQELDMAMARMTHLGLFTFSNVTALLLAGGGMDKELPCRLSIITPLGTYSAQPLLLLLKQSTD